MMIRFFYFTFIALLVSVQILAQSSTRKQLENQRKKLKKEIQQVHNLLFAEQEKEKDALEDLKDLNQKISIREQLIVTIRLESNALSNEINSNQKQLSRFTKELAKMKKDYGEMIYSAYKSKSQQSKTMFLLSSKSFYQAYKRWQYMRQYSTFRKKQGLEIQQKSTAVEHLKDSLQALKKEKDVLLSDKLQQKEKIEKDKKGQEELISQIQKRESKYKRRLRKKQREEKKLTTRIDKLIKEAIAKTNAKSGSKSSNSFALTPEAKALATKFENNKGKLPWPVENGLVVRKFGRQPHPTLKGITLQSTGLHIVTSKNANAECVFNGEVLSILTLSEGKKSIMVRHGNYITAYNNLEQVYIAKGDKVKTGQALGKIFTDKVTGKTKLLFVLFKDTQRLNPASWILKR